MPANLIEPWSEHKIGKDVCDKMSTNWTYTISGSYDKPSLLREDNLFRAPRRGEVVEVVGLRSRPELNGARGEIIGSSTDDTGRVVVRFLDEDGQRRQMRVRPSCLKRIPPGPGELTAAAMPWWVKSSGLGPSASAPSLHRVKDGGTEVSVRSRRSAGSKTSGLRSIGEGNRLPPISPPGSTNAAGLLAVLSAAEA
eukprot:TRINITY_DN31329_c0_g1_i1.p2 TRINITY_DN31329_c0_g1~~TRINITY_DN31329_c0_g1_i1.p2  ORF type:complete len:196 (+),score=21.80 TRINITY_DN31329_c0_g1_i1:101-688(+)